ncbi:MAG: GNAT family N-acetyltransferase [Oscillospiraceae bacterium]|nr:GNAT family N-acetyltransferase [Oscillospiraceae bacterium]
MALRLVKPAREHKQAWEQLMREFQQADEKYFYSKTYRQFLRRSRAHEKGKRLPDEPHVPITLYFLMRGDSPKIIGFTDIRHRLNDFLLNDLGGHAGYVIAPSERRKGYATEQLRLALEICREMGINPVLVPCHKDNIASARVIQKNGGVLEDERVSGEGKVFQRYWVEVL